MTFTKSLRLLGRTAFSRARSFLELFTTQSLELLFRANGFFRSVFLYQTVLSSLEQPRNAPLIFCAPILLKKNRGATHGWLLHMSHDYAVLIPSWTWNRPRTFGKAFMKAFLLVADFCLAEHGTPRCVNSRKILWPRTNIRWAQRAWFLHWIRVTIGNVFVKDARIRRRASSAIARYRLVTNSLAVFAVFFLVNQLTLSKHMGCLS